MVGNSPHALTLFSSTARFVAATLPFVEDGLARDEQIWVWAGQVEAAALHDALGAGAARVRFMGGYGWCAGRPALFGGLADWIVERNGTPSPAVRVLSQPQVDGCPDELVTELAGLEAAVTALAPTLGVRFLCAYDESKVSPRALDDALATHPQLDEAGAITANDESQEPGPFVASEVWRRPLPAPRGQVVDVVQARVHPAGARRVIVDLTHKAGLDRIRALDLGHAVHEVITNAVLYAHPPRVRFWAEPDRLIWEIRDHGPGIGDPFVGYRLPDPLTRLGRGLWVARRLVDLLQIRSSPTGTTVRLHMLAA
jgi:anti-sigma regulatory factor (Ser/Thr protein kinase)